MAERSPRFNPRQLGLLVVPALLGALLVFLLWQSQPDPRYWQALLQQMLAYLEAHPWALLAVLVLLPGVGFPVSPLLILVGAALGPRYGMPLACLLGILAQSICTVWTYALAVGPLRGVLARALRRRRDLPEFTPGNMVRAGLILRITPGIPYSLQNVALGVMGMRLRPYLLVSIPITSLYAVGFIVTGGAIFEGRAGLALLGLFILITLVLLTRMAAHRRRRSDG